MIFDIEKTDFGLTLYGRRNGEPDSYYWRITQWLFPWFTLIPPFGEHALGGHVWVPIDDENCWAWSINFRPDKPLVGGRARATWRRARASTANTSRARFRPKANKDNDYLIDRRRAEGEARVQRRVRLLDAGRVAAGKHGPDPGPRGARSCCRPTSAIVMARRMLYEAATGAASTAPSRRRSTPATQRVRAAGVLLDRATRSRRSGRKSHLADGLDAAGLLDLRPVDR